MSKYIKKEKALKFLTILFLIFMLVVPVFAEDAKDEWVGFSEKLEEPSGFTVEEEMDKTIDPIAREQVDSRRGLYNSNQKIVCKDGTWHASRYLRVYYIGGLNPEHYWICGAILDGKGQCNYKTNIDAWAWNTTANMRVNSVKIAGSWAYNGWIANASFLKRSFSGWAQMYFNGKGWCDYSIAAWKVGD